MIDLTVLQAAVDRAIAGEFHMFISLYRGKTIEKRIHVTLEKGSAYGKFHMKVEGHGETISEAFETALKQFPVQPLDARWDTERLTGPIEEGNFTETTPATETTTND